MSNRVWLIAGSLTAAGILAWQQTSIRSLRSELAEVRAALSSPASTSGSSPVQAPPSRPRTLVVERPTTTDDRTGDRITALEQAVSDLVGASEYLMDRGQLPPSEAKLATYRQTFLDPAASTRDRLRALSQLRRSGAFSDDLALVASNWLTTETDPNSVRYLLEGLNGATNAVLLNSILNLTASAETRVRTRAIGGLRPFLDDPRVEATLWQILDAGTDRETASAAGEMLARMPMNDQRAATFRQRAVDPRAPIEQRIVSLRALQRSETDFTDVANTLAQTAQAAQDPASRLEWIGAFDDINHPSFMLPLVQAVQDADPEIRYRATDALVDYRADPTIMQWLQVLYESDPDPRVRQQASRALQEQRSGRDSGRGRGGP